MRQVVKNRLIFLVIAIITYSLGFQLLPSEFTYRDLNSALPVIVASFGYFVFLPVLHWFLVIKAGKQKPWKIILIFSLSSVCARYSFPTELAQYFEFIAWVRYPIIGILLLIELYLMYTIVKGLWQARKLKGDPRLHLLEKYKDDDKKLTMALPLSWEPASWYYAIPLFSKKHLKAIAHLSSASAGRLHYFALCSLFVILSGLSYFLLFELSELLAIIVSSLFFYTLVFLTANHRVSRNYSIYIIENNLVINNVFIGFMMVNLDDISSVEQVEWHKSSNKEQLCLGKGTGKGKEGNIRINFTNEQTYLGMFGQFPEQVSSVILHVNEPEILKASLSQ